MDKGVTVEEVFGPQAEEQIEQPPTPAPSTKLALPLASCPEGKTLRSDLRGRTACLHDGVDLSKWPLEQGFIDWCDQDSQYECWFFAEAVPKPTTPAK
ncbi:MAG: hypothetical protein Q7S48_05115 [bacterium]|nr:hypothetical protein [bacterium]